VIATRTAILTLVATGCVAAAGIGGYLAVQNGAASPFAAASTTEVNTSAPATEAALPAKPSVTPRAAASVRQVAPAESRPAAAKSGTPQPARTEASTTTAQTSATEAVRPEPPALQADTNSDPFAQMRDEDTVARVVEPPRILYDELTVPAEAVMGIRLDSSVSSETARIEDRVTARVARDVTVDGETAVRTGSRLEGVVTLVERGGKFHERARIGIRFNTLVLADNTRLPIQTDVILRTGDAPGGEATAKVGGAAVVGTIIGSVFGGKKGAAIGSAAGAATGAAAVAAGSRNAAVIPGDTALTLRLTAPLTVDVPRDPAPLR
jgi:hypothetical protein